MTTERVPYAGWKECVRLANDTVELIVTAEVGPRIIRYGFIGGPNEFVEYAEQVGRRGEPVYRSYGGHRLWVAPETEGWTNHPDNQPVDVSEHAGEVVFTAQPEPGTGLQKSIGVFAAPTGSSVRVRHYLRNTTDKEIECALWALSVMAPGGTAIIPQERFIPHGEKVLPARPMTVWHYTDMTDPRWRWGEKFVRLQQLPEASTPQKFGVMTSDGWAGYARADRLFVKRFPFDPTAVYPDFGCNVEVFTNQKMLELESLGPIAPLRPGETREHVERWGLFRPGPLPQDDETLAQMVAPLVAAL